MERKCTELYKKKKKMKKSDFYHEAQSACYSLILEQAAYIVIFPVLH
jgi:hypothetical protein